MAKSQVHSAPQRCEFSGRKNAFSGTKCTGNAAFLFDCAPPTRIVVLECGTECGTVRSVVLSREEGGEEEEAGVCFAVCLGEGCAVCGTERGGGLGSIVCGTERRGWAELCVVLKGGFGSIAVLKGGFGQYEEEMRMKKINSGEMAVEQ
eukprot:3404146-Rhodomonas_salina.1